MKMFESKTKKLEGEIDGYLDCVSRAGLIFLEGAKSYISSNMDRFEKNYQDITVLETDADNKRRDIKRKLYSI